MEAATKKAWLTFDFEDSLTAIREPEHLSLTNLSAEEGDKTSFVEKVVAKKEPEKKLGFGMGMLPTGGVTLKNVKNKQEKTKDAEIADSSALKFDSVLNESKATTDPLKSSDSNTKKVEVNKQTASVLKIQKAERSNNLVKIAGISNREITKEIDASKVKSIQTGYISTFYGYFKEICFYLFVYVRQYLNNDKNHKDL